jgi:Tol biopolymer transport system component/CubicO group peptidase (beta-lactamase class C family)
MRVLSTVPVCMVLVCTGVVVTSASVGAEQTPSASPPVGRVAREFARGGGKSVIVFLSAGGKEYAATAGPRRPAVAGRFRIGSVTKTFTATIVLQLVAEGKLRMTDSLEKHLPGVVPRGGEITLRRLLNHRSGLVNFTDYGSWLGRAGRSASTRPIDVLRFAGSKPLAFEPGSRGVYSNTNYIALGLVIEKVTGRSYGQELEQRILRPLELDHTELPETRRLPDLTDEGVNPNVVWAAGAIVSNARDLSRFYSALLSGRLLSAGSLGQMKRAVEGTGLGVGVTDLPCGRFWGHGGFILDYATLVTASEKGDRVAVVSIRGGWSGLPPPDLLLCPKSAAACATATGSRPPPDFALARAKIAFVRPRGRNPGIYVMNADGSGQRMLVGMAGGDSSWSPDGRIAFVTGRDGNPEVYVINADGSGQRRLTCNVVFDTAPAWSPDGTRIAFLSLRDVGGLYVMNADGSGQRWLARDAGGHVWSPDSRRIAFTRLHDGNYDVYVMNADGSGERRLTRSPKHDWFPAWSPDGRKIAFVSGRDGNFEIYVVKVDGSEQGRLTRTEAPERGPAWSPDGTRIAFVSERDGNFEVYVMNSDGSEQVRLTHNAARDVAPAWSPDGRKIAFGSKRDGNWEIYVMNADGTAERNLTRSPTDEASFAWSPAQKR